MQKLTEEEIKRHYDEVCENLRHYTQLHKEIMEIIISEMEPYLEQREMIGKPTKDFCIGFTKIMEKSRFDVSIVSEIVNDFVSDGLLTFHIRIPETETYYVTNRGVYCLKKVIG
jgi:predicted transcriptional regulator